MRRGSRTAALVLTAIGALVATTAPAVAANEVPAASHVVINEAYVNGGSTGATYQHKFVELYNPTDTAVSLAGWSLQYRAYSGTGPFGSVVSLQGSIKAGGHYLIQGSANADNGADLPTPDATTGTSWSGNSNGGTLVLSDSTAPLTGVGDLARAPGSVDLLGYRASNTFETAPTSVQASVTRSMMRTGHSDSDDNAADFSLAEPTPCGTAGCDSGTDPDPDPEPEPVANATIAAIQGSGTASPMVDKFVKTRGVVTAAYPTGGFNGAFIQTEGTGGAVDRGSSDGIFVYSSAFANDVKIGDFVEVTGKVTEFYGLTELSPADGAWTKIAEAHQEVKAATVAYPRTDGEREALEGMLIDPQGSYTITNNYSTNQYGDIGLATGDEPLRQPTNEARPDSPGYEAVLADNAARLVTLDDGASTNFLRGAAMDTPLPWLAPDNEVRVGAAVDFTGNVVMDFRNDSWKFQPTTELTAANADAVQPATFSKTRTAAPEDVGGGVQIATFNVLNYFTTTGEDAGCTSFYEDRDGNPITVNRCDNAGPRGAANDENLQRQQAKIVNAINTIDADVVSLEEIENSAAFDQDRDTALSALVDALNASTGAKTWAFVPSPAVVPEAEDVIRTAFIYRLGSIETVGDSQILIDPAFNNARQPLAQAFKPAGTANDETFAVIANHFKSKGSGEGADADQGDGQGASNASRIRQAEALVEFADDFKADAATDRVLLAGDFNSYTKEDPLAVLEEAGYVNVAQTMTDEETYQYGGMIGSLDHVFVSSTALDEVTGADIWNINAYESVAREYSRYNYNATNFYNDSPYRSSDHDPIIVGLGAVKTSTTLNAEQVPPLRVKSGKTKAKIVATVEAPQMVPSGSVAAYYRGELVGRGTLHKGSAKIKLARFATAGTKELTVVYSGEPGVYSSTDSINIRVID